MWAAPRCQRGKSAYLHHAIAGPGQCVSPGKVPDPPQPSCLLGSGGEWGPVEVKKILWVKRNLRCTNHSPLKGWAHSCHATFMKRETTK